MSAAIMNNNQIPLNKHIDRKRVSGKRGAMLMVILTSLFMIVTLTVAVLTITSNSLYTNRQQVARASALNVAESGAERGALWIRQQAIPPSGTADINITSSVGNPPTGTWSVIVRPDTNNPIQFLKIYRIISAGTVRNQTKRVEVVVKQSSFGKYAYFTDSETSSGGGAIWWNSKDKIDGPVHSNNKGGTNFNIDYSAWSSNTPTRPIFLDMVTGSGTRINYTPSRPTTETAFKKVFLNGSSGYRLGAEIINLPPTTTAQKEAAWGAASGFPTTTGVYLRADSAGGLFIQGDSTIVMSVSGTGNQVMTIKQGTNTTVVTYNKSTGTITTSGPMGSGSATTASSMSNGVIYCTGNVTSLSGTVADNVVSSGQITQRSAFTIATDTSGGKDITVTGDIVYKTRPNKTLAPDAAVNLAAGTLGLVARNIKIADDGTSAHVHANREIDAVMMAGGSNTTGSISVNNYNLGTKGTLKVVGGLIQSVRGIVASLSGGSVSTGYAKDYSYDPRMSAAPPPFYPTTGQYDRMSWQVL
jgi:hypothetical protein